MERKVTMVKIKETLTTEQRTNLILNQTVTGIFTELFVETDPFYNLLYPLCLGYYTIRSALKTVSPVYHQFAEISDDPNTAIGKHLIRPKFIDKWTRVYDTLITKQYDPLKDYEYEEHRGGNNSDTTTYNVSIEDNGKTGTKETVTTSRDTSNDVYGFNSSVPVGDDTSTENMTETTEGLANDNTTYNKQDKTGTDAKAFIIDEDVTKSARNVSGADLVQSELNLRNKQIFFDIVYADIDSIFALSVYG